MKKTLLTTITICLALFVFGQSRIQTAHPKLNFPQTATFHQTLGEAPLVEKPATIVRAVGASFWEEEIGETVYDLQTNNALSNRIHRFEDGTIGAVWTLGIAQAPNFPDRGTGYNFHNGTSWGPISTNRVETIRAGWPSYAPLGMNGEIIVSHDFSGGPAGLIFNKRDIKGAGEWQQFTFTGPPGHTNIVWPRMATAGADRNSIHLLAMTRPSGNGGTPYLGQDGALLYSRSTDGGNTWNINNVLLDGLGADSYKFISADQYVWADSQGETIAFVTGSQWRDLVLMKSSDNGTTWEKTVIWEHPYPFFDWDVTITTDTLWAVDGSFSVALDNDGMAHVTFAITRVAHTETGPSYSYWPYTDGIAYWNESMGPLPQHPTNPHKTLHTDFLYDNGNLIGWLQDVDGDGEINIFELELQVYRTLGLSTMPTIFVKNNVVVVIFSATTETFDDGSHYYKKLWARYSPDGGYTWSDFMHLTDDIMHMFDECIYAQLYGYENGYIYFIYQADETPGLALDDDHPYQNNRIIFSEYQLVLTPGIGELPSQSAMTVHPNYPNPAREFTHIRVDLPAASSLTLKVYNLTGQQIDVLDKGRVNSGQHLFRLDTSGYLPGIYLYTVQSGNARHTGKLVVR